MKILVATDGTQAAIDAARKALDLLRPDAEIVLVSVVHAYEDPMEEAGGFEGPLMSPEEAEAEYQRELANGEAALQRTASALGKDTETRLIPAAADPGHAIVDAARQLHADLIVLGSIKKGFFLRLLTGSVGDYVVHHAPCPVLIVPHE